MKRRADDVPARAAADRSGVETGAEALGRSFYYSGCRAVHRMRHLHRRLVRAARGALL